MRPRADGIDGSAFAKAMRTMRPSIYGVLICGGVLIVVLASGCSSRAQEPAASAQITTAQPVAPQAVAAGMAHGDHNPHHGGVVYMYDDMHYEVVLAPDGHHRVYFTDAVREDLPASVASSVTLTVERPKGLPEALTGAIDEAGESWLLTGQPVAETDTSVRVAFVAKGTPYWIDVPFIPPAQ